MGLTLHTILYLETMKGIAQNISDDYQANLNKSGL